jgi:arylsulfatase A-like enzyme
MRLLSVLEESKRLESSLVVLTADHGADFGTGHPMDRAVNFYEAVLNVPFFVHLPNTMAPDFKRGMSANKSARVGNVDIYATLMDLWGQWPQESGRPALSGRSLFRPIAADRSLVSVNTGDLRSWSSEGFALYVGHKKLLVDPQGVHLFDLAVDPGELHSRFDTLPEAERNDFLKRVGRSDNLLRILSRLKPDLAREAEELARSE